jgi:hypothetical protein
MIQRLTRNV